MQKHAAVRVDVRDIGQVGEGRGRDLRRCKRNTRDTDHAVAEASSPVAGPLVRKSRVPLGQHRDIVFLGADEIVLSIPRAVDVVQEAITKGAQSAYQTARTLAWRSEVLKAVAPKLRTRGSADAVALFLREDAVAPSSMLSPYIRDTNTKMSGRAARRLCDRLVELGAVKELTGRSTFRLYGIAP